jgi:hypothetical protein
MDCSHDNTTISGVTSFAYSSKSDENNENSLNCLLGVTYLKLDFGDGCDATETVNEIVKEKCLGNTTCSVTLQTPPLKANCTQELKSKSKFYYFSYNCYDQYLNLPNDNKISRTSMAYIIVILDIASMLCLLISIFIIQAGIRRLDVNYRKHNTLISNFTLHLTGVDIPYSLRHDELADIIAHFKSVLSHETEKSKNFISPLLVSNYISDNKDMSKVQSEINNKIASKIIFYEINYPKLNASKLDDVIKLNSLIIKRDSLIVKIKSLEKALGVSQIQEYNSENLVSNNLLNNGIIQETSNFDSKTKTIKQANSNKQYVKLQKYTDELIKTDDKIKDTERRIADLSFTGELNTIKELYLTTRNQNLARMYKNLYKKTRCDRCCLIFCCQGSKIKHLYFKDRWLNIKLARDEPSNIKWENVTYPSWKRFFRKLLAYTVSFILIIASFGIIIGGKFAQEELSKDFNINLDCSQTKVELSDVKLEYENTLLSSKEKVETYCYCWNSLVDDGYEKTKNFSFLSEKNSTLIYPCQDWLDAYIKLYSLNIGTIIIVPLINSLIYVVLRSVTKFERNKTLSEDMISNFFKIFSMQSINMGIVILLVNIKVNSIKDEIPKFPILTGNYKDFDPVWFFYVGSVIVSLYLK